MNIRIVTVAAMALALTSIARGDDPKPSDSKQGASDKTTIHGIVSGVTIEGEMLVDPVAKKIVEAEGAYLTVVGIPGDFHHEKGASKDKEKEKDTGKISAEKAERRANVYMVWLSPKTKICSCCDESGKETEKKECAMEKLEIGDRVEVTFSKREGSAANVVAFLSDVMKAKHGRNRIHTVDAQEITILPTKHDEGSSDAHKAKESK